MKRRNFLNWLSLSGGIIWLTNTIAGCTEKTNSNQSSTINKPSSSSETTKSGEFMLVGTIQELKQKERIIVNLSDNDSVLVIQDPDNSANVFALNSRCTHRGCKVDWDTDSKKILCPCHGSVFKSNGEVLTTPASESLKGYETKIEGNAILIKV